MGHQPQQRRQGCVEVLSHCKFSSDAPFLIQLLSVSHQAQPPPDPDVTDASTLDMDSPRATKSEAASTPKSSGSRNGPSAQDVVSIANH